MSLVELVEEEAQCRCSGKRRFLRAVLCQKLTQATMSAVAQLLLFPLSGGRKGVSFLTSSSMPWAWKSIGFF
jgi:hypothetical protein